MMITFSKYDIVCFDFIVFEVYHAALISCTHYTHILYIILFNSMHGFQLVWTFTESWQKNKKNKKTKSSTVFPAG